MDWFLFFCCVFFLVSFLYSLVWFFYCAFTKKYPQVLYALYVFVASTTAFLGMVTTVGLVLKYCALHDINELQPEHVYTVLEEPAQYQPRQESEKKFASQYLTWLLRDDQQEPRAYRFSEKLECKRFVVFRNENGEMEVLPRDIASSRDAEKAEPVTPSDSSGGAKLKT